MNKSTFWGIVFTTAWLAFIGIRIHAEWPSFCKLNLNELGDFLAGAVAPLAFGWLVLGYFQQGKELSQNTKALELQSRELRMTAEATNRLVEISQSSNDLEEERIRREERLEKMKIMPNFICEGASGNRQKRTFTLVNFGGDANKVTVYTMGESGTADNLSEAKHLIAQAASVNKNATIKFAINYIDVDKCDVYLSFNDISGKNHCLTFEALASGHFSEKGV